MILKKLSLPKFSVGILLLSLAVNFIAFSGFGNVYFSTLIIFLLFILLLVMVSDKMLYKRSPIIGLLIFALILFSTILNVVFDGGAGIKSQLVFIIIYFQSFLVFVIAYYALPKVEMKYVFGLFLLVGFFLFMRVALEEPQNLLSLSTVRGERIEANFAGAVNNYALLIGVCLIVSFFYISSKFWKILFSLIFLTLLILTMSRALYWASFSPFSW